MGTLSPNLCQGDASPWIPVFFKGVEGVGFKSVQTFYALPRWYSLQGRSPAYPFFRKEKIHPHRRRSDCDAESFERVQLRTYFLRRGKAVGRTESPSQGYRLTAASLPCPRRSEGTYGRGDRRRTGGTTVAEGFRSWHKVPPRRACERDSIMLTLFGAQSLPRTQEGAFFFTKKAYCGNQTLCVAESRKSVQTCPHPFSALKSP